MPTSVTPPAPDPRITLHLTMPEADMLRRALGAETLTSLGHGRYRTAQALYQRLATAIEHHTRHQPLERLG